MSDEEFEEIEEGTADDPYRERYDEDGNDLRDYSEERTLSVHVFGKRKVRVVEIDGEQWFVAKDVCGVLELKNSRKAVADLDDDEVLNVTSSYVQNFREGGKGVGRGGASQVNLISEPGVYRLIFQSRKPEAKAFKRWVFHDVLPAIRKRGYYELKKQYEAGEKNYHELCDKYVALERIAGDPKEVAKVNLRRYILNRMSSTDKHLYEDGEREYYIYSNNVNEELLCTKEEFVAQVATLYPEAIIKKVRKCWQFWGVGSR